MSGRKHREIRALAHHSEYGGNWPLVMKTNRELESMLLPTKVLARAYRLAKKKLQKQLLIWEREDATS